jgi:multidrug efflux pump subunit AcrA (membrane-fusion protein)
MIIGSASDDRPTTTGSASDGHPMPIVLVPKRAVTEQGGRPHVWVVVNRTATRRPVTLGSERLDQVEVRSGVVPGDAVILNPPTALADRALVRVKGT